MPTTDPGVHAAPADRDVAGYRCKQVIAVRRDLRLGVGKTAAQAAHAAVEGVLRAQERHQEWVRDWFTYGQAKIVVAVEDEDALLAVAARAEAAGLPVAVVHDGGLTQVDPGTRTCLAVGPAPRADVDEVTSALPLL